MANKELAAGLKKAKKLNKDGNQRMFFALAIRSGTDGMLIVSRKKITQRRVNDLKEEADCAKVVKGVCFGDGDKIVFETAKLPAPAWDRLVKKLVRVEAGMLIEPEFRLNEEAEEDSLFVEAGVEEGEEPLPDGETEVEQKAKLWHLQLKELMPKILELRKNDLTGSKILQQLVQEGLAQVRQNDDEAAAATLEKIKRLLLRAEEEAKAQALRKSGRALELEEFKRRLAWIVPAVNQYMGRYREQCTALNIVLTKTVTEMLTAGQGDKARIELDKAEDTLRAIEVFDPRRARADAQYQEILANDLPRAETLHRVYREVVEIKIVSEEAFQKLEVLEVQLQRGAPMDYETWRAKIRLDSLHLPEKPIASGSNGCVSKLITEEGTPPLILKHFFPDADPEFRDEVESGFLVACAQEEAFYNRIGDHPNIARCLGVKEIDGTKGLLMESLNGGTVLKAREKLNERLEKGEISHEQYWGMMQYTLTSMLQALDHLSSKGVMHLDIKSDNVMYDEWGQVKLVDFGQAAVAGTTHFVPGAGPVQSPEVWKALTEQEKEARGQENKAQLARNELNSKSDVFSLGCLIYAIGEGEDFSSGGSKWSEKDGAGKDKQALHPLDKDEEGKPIFKRDENQPGVVIREPGKYPYQTAYVEFVNKVLSPNSKDRLTPRQALEHPFLKQRLMTDDQARQFFQELNKPVKKPKPRNIESSRPRIDTMLSRVSGHSKLARKTVKDLLDAHRLKTPLERIADRDRLLSYRSLLSHFKTELELAVLPLSDRNEPELVEDRNKLEDGLAAMREVLDPLKQALTDIETFVSAPVGLTQQSNSVLEGRLFDSADVATRTSELSKRRTVLSAQFDELESVTAPRLDMHLYELRQLGDRIATALEQAGKDMAAVDVLRRHLTANVPPRSNSARHAAHQAALHWMGQFIISLEHHQTTLGRLSSQANERATETSSQLQAAKQTLQDLQAAVKALIRDVEMAGRLKEAGQSFSDLTPSIESRRSQVIGLQGLLSPVPPPGGPDLGGEVAELLERLDEVGEKMVALKG